jgi:secondary thiamine-phosphate synthase enzyme
MIRQVEIILPAFPRGFHLITGIIENAIDFSGVETGILHIFIKHTSAAVMINENYDPSVRVDLESAFNHIVKEDQPYYTHTLEGSDDMPAHIKAAMIGSNVSIPVRNGKLNLGTWQGIYLCEFRNRGGKRKLVLTLMY